MFLIDTLYAILLMAIIFGGINQVYFQSTVTVLSILHFAKFFIEGVLVLRIVAEALTTQYYITETELISVVGIFNQHEKVYDLTKLRTIEVHESWLGRNLQYGDIHLIIASSGLSENIWLRGIRNAHQYERLIRQVTLDQNQTVEITSHM